MQTLQTTEPLPHIENIQKTLQELIQHLREDVERVKEPRAQALFETSAEVILGLNKAFEDYKEGKETAWRR